MGDSMVDGSTVDNMVVDSMVDKMGRMGNMDNEFEGVFFYDVFYNRHNHSDRHRICHIDIA